MSTLPAFTDEQLLQITLAYELSGSAMPLPEYLETISVRYKEFQKAYKILRKSTVRTGSKKSLGL